jgi:hemerythrin
MAICWDESLRLGQEAIDAQHEEIFAQINNLSDKITEGADTIEVRKHFFDEEKLMVQYQYYGIHEQQKQHNHFKNEIDELSQMLRKKGQTAEVALRIETTLLRYFVNHISVLDKELSDFINSQNK